MTPVSYRVRWLGGHGPLNLPKWSISLDGAKSIAEEAAGMPLKWESSKVSILEAWGPLDGKPGVYTVDRTPLRRFTPVAIEK